jgi:hypothetical protein
MSDKLEQLSNLITMVVEQNNIVEFGSKEHLDLLYLFKNAKTIQEILTSNDYHMQKAIEIIKDNSKLLNIFNEIIKDT